MPTLDTANQPASPKLYPAGDALNAARRQFEFEYRDQAWHIHAGSGQAIRIDQAVIGCPAKVRNNLIRGYPLSIYGLPAEVHKVIDAATSRELGINNLPMFSGGHWTHRSVRLLEDGTVERIDKDNHD